MQKPGLGHFILVEILLGTKIPDDCARPPLKMDLIVHIFGR